MNLEKVFTFKINGKGKVYQATLIDTELWYVSEMKRAFGRNYIESRLCEQVWVPCH